MTNVIKLRTLHIRGYEDRYGRTYLSFFYLIFIDEKV